MHAAQATSAPAQRPASPERRDWFAWYEDLSPDERREIRGRLLTASYDEVKADPDLRQFFFIHSEDVAGEEPGTERLGELHAVLRHLRGSTEPDAAEKRRKAVAFLLAEYQRYLRDNPWDV